MSCYVTPKNKPIFSSKFDKFFPDLKKISQIKSREQRKMSKNVNFDISDIKIGLLDKI